MDKEHMLDALERGEKVTHRLFSPEEWVQKIGGMYKFEDGCLCTPTEFWCYRLDDTWNNRWSIYEPLAQEQTSD